VFLMRNVHDDAPVVFQTRWAMSYLRGPLTRTEISRLTSERRPPMKTGTMGPEAPRASAPTVRSAGASGTAPHTGSARQRPQIDPRIPQLFVRPAPDAVPPLVYRPVLLGTADVRFADRGARVEHRERTCATAPIDRTTLDVSWRMLDGPGPELAAEPADGIAFAEPHADALRPGSYPRWRTALARALAAQRSLVLWRSPSAGLVSRPGESEGEFRARLTLAGREQRDAAIEKLRARYATRIERLRQRAARADERVDREREQYDQQKLQTGISLGATVLGALFGRSRGGATIGRATTTARGVGRAARERDHVARAEEDADAAREELAALERQIEHAVAAMPRAGDDVERLELRPREANVRVERVALAWIPEGASG
jgi:hypothetical protein